MNFLILVDTWHVRANGLFWVMALISGGYARVVVVVVVVFAVRQLENVRLWPVFFPDLRAGLDGRSGELGECDRGCEVLGC
ncbi:hypothetical protein RRF57_012792 [Xylaria bambusicola]|uniref:Uncharacterized protein n=1 Tax=Xylaria bambusicola TaxID=326684 RepID=A0AAN7UQC3_9PEZI